MKGKPRKMKIWTKMKYVFLTISFLLIAIPAGLFAEEPLLDDVFIKNLSHGFSYEYLYALKDGKIWIKPNEKNTGIKGGWELFNKTGIPGGKNAASFKKGDSIVQFSTEATMITAVSNRGRFYIWQPTLKEKTTWSDVTGSPLKDALYLPKNKTWCFSLSLMRAPWKRLTPMHEMDIISYWEDIDGNKTEFGFTATIYAVDPDGQRVRYVDTGLPTSWHKAFSSPERGRFIIENMSSAASTVFVINRSGKMYTRMIDYEMEGGCPALKFVYTRAKRTNDDRVVPIMEAVRTLPQPDWREQEPVPDVLNNKSGKAALTKNITILLTGKGNAARELRVQGRNADGVYGYWKKPVFGAEWTFMATGERFNDEEIITGYLSMAPQGPPLDKRYKGTLSRWCEDTLSVELVDFYYYSTPCTLRVHIGEKHFDMKFHTVDMWSPTVQEKDFPELIGSPAGEPKLLQGTIDIPKNILDSKDKEIKKVIDTYFRDFNLVPIAFKVAADDDRVIISSRIIRRSLNKWKDYKIRSRINMDLVNADSPAGVNADMFYTSLANIPALEVPDDRQSFTKADIPRIDALIELNKKTLKEIKDIAAKFRAEHLKAGAESALGSVIYYIFDGIINLIGLPYWETIFEDPGTRENIIQLGGLSYTGGTPMNEYAILNLGLSCKNPKDYERAVKILNERISLLKKIRGDLSK